MTADDLNRVLDAEFERCTPEISILSSAIVARGRRRVRARRAGLAGGGVAAVAAVALLMPIVFGGGSPAADPAPAGEPSPPAVQDPSDFPVELDPDVDYFWSATVASGSADPAGEALTAGWDDQLTAQDFPAATGPHEVFRQTEVLVPDTDPAAGSEVWSGDRAEVAFERPVYRSTVLSDESEGFYDQLVLSVYVGGTYLRGGRTSDAHPGTLLPDPRYLAPGCGQESGYVCAESVGPNGEGILTVNAAQDPSHGATAPALFVVVYRTDGTAAVLSDIAIETGDASGARPFLTVEQMTAMLLALPIVPVA